MSKFNPLIIGLILISLIIGLHEYQVTENPCYGMLRLHVIANSDSPADQALKLKVRDAVLTTMQARFKGINNADQAITVAGHNLAVIQQAAERVISREGQDYTVKVCMGRFGFPTRYYDEKVFPPGEYEAVRVILGRGEGHNWWCVLFPPICLKKLPVNDTSSVKPPEVRLKLVDIIRDKFCSSTKIASPGRI
ncbi:MAG: stage II sporulation protein R [Acidobacteriota bacterium]